MIMGLFGNDNLGEEIVELEVLEELGGGSRRKQHGGGLVNDLVQLEVAEAEIQIIEDIF